VDVSRQRYASRCVCQGSHEAEEVCARWRGLPLGQVQSVQHAARRCHKRLRRYSHRLQLGHHRNTRRAWRRRMHSEGRTSGFTGCPGVGYPPRARLRVLRRSVKCLEQARELHPPAVLARASWLTVLLSTCLLPAALLCVVAAASSPWLRSRSAATSHLRALARLKSRLR
jgi:hypothetical protein